MSPTFAAALCLAVSLGFSATTWAGPRLLDATDVVAPGDPARLKLVAEIQELEDSRPGLWVGRGLMIGGAVAIPVGLLVAWGGIAVITNLGTIGKDLAGVILAAIGGTLVFLVGVVLGVAGAVVLIVGLVKTLRSTATRMDHDAKIEDAVRRLEEYDRSQRPPAMPPALPDNTPAFPLMTF